MDLIDEQTNYARPKLLHDFSAKNSENLSGASAGERVNLSRRHVDELSIEPAPVAVRGCKDQSKEVVYLTSDLSMNDRSPRLPETKISDFLGEFCGVNTLLLKAIHNAAAKDVLPYQTVRAYIEAGQDGVDRMLEVEGINQDLLGELDELIIDSGYTADASSCTALGEPHESFRPESSELDSKVRDKWVLSLPLLEFISKQKTVSVRLSNALATAVSKWNCPFKTVGDYLQYESREDALRKLANIGRKTAAEFEKLVCGSLGPIAATVQAGIINSPRMNDHGYVDIGAIVENVLSLLKSPQQDVIVARLVERNTLETVGSAIGVTRERVRQIESKSLKLISTKLGPVILQAAEIICARFCDENINEIKVDDFSDIVTCDIRNAVLYLAILEKLYPHQSSLGFSEGNIFVRSHYVPCSTWKKTLADKLRTLPLPLTLNGALSDVSSVPGFYIRDHFQRLSERRGTNNGELRQRYGTSRMCIDVLRKAGRPLHTSDVRARIYALFQTDIEEHAINATLGRLKKVLITAPGTYALYESLPFTPAQLESIRRVAQEHLEAKGVFLSSKILFDLAFSQQLAEYPSGLNHYVLMGIVQDDERFITKRGNMVGLVTFDLTKTYTPLQDEIRAIVLEHGPITLPEIAERLSDTRELCNDSGIRLVLSQSPEVVRIGRRTFDSLHRFFDSRQAYDDLLLAVRISLLERKKTAYAVTQDLGRLHLKGMTPHSVEWVLSSMEDVRTENGVYELAETDQEMAKYNDVVVGTLRANGTAKDVQASLCSIFSSEYSARLTSLDVRFIRDPETASVREGTELKSILLDFDF